MYEVVVAKGTIEIIEHKRRDSIFNVNDDPLIRGELLDEVNSK